MHATVALLTLALGLACLLHTARAHANGLASSMCETFHVVHGSPREDDSKDVKVELLLENGNVTDCFSTQREYLVRLSAGETLIKGFILQATSGAKLPSRNRSRMIPFDTTSGPCDNSVSHLQVRSSSSKELIFPVTTRRSTRPLVFRYSVVFAYGSFQQDRYVEIPCCRHQQNQKVTTSGLHVVETGSVESSGSGDPTVPPTRNQTAEPTVPPTHSGTVITLNRTEEVTEKPPFTTPEPLGTLVEGHCGKSIVNIIKSYNVARDGVRYNCTIKKPLKQTLCNETCDIDAPVVCQVHKMIDRRKGFVCIPLDPNERNESYETTFPETVTTGCQCFRPDLSS